MKRVSDAEWLYLKQQAERALEPRPSSERSSDAGAHDDPPAVQPTAVATTRAIRRRIT
ncbi:hypothetical protein GCM10009840_23200 [Pseudolysinimonas kribbensis]|uniref:Transposase n=1 Tax=Pseudolysinimonas kribbensis TaxID=433641 RepID=A0ABQ6KFH2_9MICO|nr:hypothetical protein GCM10025881_37600 [Pseudolysinimonas kribbensis]